MQGLNQKFSRVPYWSGAYTSLAICRRPSDETLSESPESCNAQIMFYRRWKKWLVKELQIYTYKEMKFQPFREMEQLAQGHTFGDLNTKGQSQVYYCAQITRTRDKATYGSVCIFSHHSISLESWKQKGRCLLCIIRRITSLGFKDTQAGHIVKYIIRKCTHKPENPKKLWHGQEHRQVSAHSIPGEFVHV